MIIWYWAEKLNDDGKVTPASPYHIMDLSTSIFVRSCELNDVHVNDTALVIRQIKSGNDSIAIRLGAQDPNSGWYVETDKLSVCCPTLFMVLY